MAAYRSTHLSCPTCETPEFDEKLEHSGGTLWRGVGAGGGNSYFVLGGETGWAAPACRSHKQHGPDWPEGFIL